MMRPSNTITLYRRKQNGTPARRSFELPSAKDQPSEATHIIVVDARPVAREMIVQWLRRHHRARTVRSFESTARLLAEASSLQSAILVILGGFVPENTQAGLHGAIEDLLARRPTVPVIVIGDRDDGNLARAALRSGARAFLPLTSDSRVAAAAINLVLAGGSYVPVAATNDLNAPATEPPPAPAAETNGASAELADLAASTRCGAQIRLTPRESDVLSLLRQGQPNKQIARHLGMHESTVKTHLSNLIRKFEVKNRTGVVLRAGQMGLPAEVAAPKP
jgi:DNA-binding NarL/FixJ family response regulator